MFKRMATDLDAQLTTHRDWRVRSKMPGCCLMVDTVSVIRDMRSLSDLTANYSDHWMGLGRPVVWPLRSQDLTPVDFFLWGHTKALICMLPIHSEEDLIAHIVEGAATWYFWVHTSVCCIIVSCDSRPVAIHLNTCSKLVWNTTFLRILQWFSLISNLGQTQFDSP